MHNSQDHTRSRQAVGRNVVRMDSQQNGSQYHGNQQQWNEGGQYQQQSAPGGPSYAQQSPGSPSYTQQGPRGASYPQHAPVSGGSYPQYIDKVRHAQTRYDAEDLEHNKNFGELRNKFGSPSVQQSSSGGVRMNARPGSSSYSARKPVFSKPATASELGELGWIPKNKPSPHSQSRYMPASMRSPPVNRKQYEQGDAQGYQSSGVPAWQGTLRSAGGPRAYQVHDHGLQNDQWQNGGGGRYEPSREPGDTGEPHSSRYYQLINENNDQMEQFMKLPQHRTAYATGSQAPSSSSYNPPATYDASTGGYGQGASNY